MDYPEALALLNVVVFSASVAFNGYWAWRGRSESGLATLQAGRCLLSVWVVVAYAFVLYGEQVTAVNVSMLRPAMLLIGLLYLVEGGYLHAMRQAIGHANEIGDIISGRERCRQELAELRSQLATSRQNNNDIRLALNILRSRLDEQETDDGA
jgi:hypothetical protein